MNLKTKLVTPRLWMIVFACVFPGCQHSRQQTQTVCHQPPSIMTPHVQVTVIAAAAPREQLIELDFLTAEIRNGLAAAGGLRMMESPPRICGSDCAAIPQSSTHETAATGDVVAAEFTQPPEPWEIPEGALPPTDSAMNFPADAIEVTVVVDEFIAYRPMHLAATITVRNTITGEEITTIQGTWYGRERHEPIADANHALQRALLRPPPRAHIEADALGSLSPRMFLKAVARELVPSIHGACLSSNCVMIQK